MSIVTVLKTESENTLASLSTLIQKISSANTIKQVDQHHAEAKELLGKLRNLCRRLGQVPGSSEARSTVTQAEKLHWSISSAITRKSHELKQTVLTVGNKIKQQSRSELLSSGLQDSTADDDLAQSSQLSNMLKRTRNNLRQQLDHGTSNLNQIAESGKDLKKITSELGNFDANIDNSRSLLFTMKRRDVIDQLVIWTGFFIYVCTLFYIFTSRLIPGIYG
eukprot:m.55760 g.55760  ORF g.55760 m.55760 type:complete len:221 (-) comp18670_c0_seq2:57-719(-)